MLDIKLFRENPKAIKESEKKRGHNLKIVDEVIKYDELWRGVVKKVTKLKHKRNVVSKEINKLKKAGKSTTAKIRDIKKVVANIKALDEKAERYFRERDKLRCRVGNILHPSVSIGKDESENVEIRRWGKPPKFDFEPKSHLEILQNLNLIDVESATKVSGSAFYYLKGYAVLLDLALQKFTIDFLMKKGFQVFEPPFIINKRSYEGMIGDLLDFAEASYKIEGEDLYLIPTAEYPLGSMFIDKTFNKKELPLRICGVSACFRREVGTHGKYSKGLFRVHQFNKVEQFILCLPEESWKLLEELQKNSEELYRKLGLHYRVVLACSADTPAKAAKMYDIEIWMADGKFRESGSNSNCTDYQTRRLNIKFREKEGSAPIGFVHALNNTALATSRTIIAILEQFQQKDGSVKIPKALWPYMNGIKVIKPKKAK